MIPGAKQLTLILSGANSSANTFVRPNNAVLLIEYGPRSYGKNASILSIQQQSICTFNGVNPPMEETKITLPL